MSDGDTARREMLTSRLGGLRDLLEGGGAWLGAIRRIFIVFIIVHSYVMCSVFE